MSGQRGRPFQPGNKLGRGRPRGSRNKKSSDRLIAEYAEPLTKKCIMGAMQGDKASMRMCMERMSAPERENRVKLKMPVVKTLEDVKQANATAIAAVGKGQITPSQGETVTRMLEAQGRLIKDSELEPRMEQMEKSLAQMQDK